MFTQNSDPTIVYNSLQSEMEFTVNPHPIVTGFPETPGISRLLSICIIDKKDGKKLIIGTRTCNFLITSSMRLDVNLGTATAHFTPSTNTRLFLDRATLDIVKSMLGNQTVNERQQMPILYQLRQLRSKFDQLSTYTKGRASSSSTSCPLLQPTLSPQNGSTSTNLSQEKIGNPCCSCVQSWFSCLP